jgi:hypothetical protein
MNHAAFVDTSKPYRVDTALTNLVNVNGERFRGPYEKDGQ